jgi:hypothetical protein
MSFSIVAALAVVLTGVALAQPTPTPVENPKNNGTVYWQGFPAIGWVPDDDPKMRGAYFKLEVLGSLKIAGRIDADPKTLEVYSRGTGVELGRDNDARLIQEFELYLGGDPEFVKRAKQLDGKWVVAEGDLVIVHGPVLYQYGLGLECSGQTGYSHPRPRYVIKVRRLAAAPAGVPNDKNAPYIRIEVRGVVSTLGKNPSLRDMSARKAGPSTVVRTNQCNLYLFLGKDDKWLARAKELNGEAAVARGELISVHHDPPENQPFAILPHPVLLLDVSELQAPSAPTKRE